MKILSLNSGSSSVKFSLFSIENLLFSGKIDRIGMDKSRFLIYDSQGEVIEQQSEKIQNHQQALQKWLKWIRDREIHFDAIGHRIVQGGPDYSRPCRVTQGLIEVLRKLAPFDPDHLPDEIKVIEFIQEHFPNLPQVACFDTFFHSEIPDVAKHFAIPRKFWPSGVFRYGFHGLSYEYVLQELSKTDPKWVSEGSIVIAHLGSGASMSAISRGKSVDTSMGFTPLGGLIMSTRSGDLDPGVLLYLQKEKKLSVDELSRLLNQESGLLGISELSADMENLLEVQDKNSFAAEAIEMFCYQAKKFLGAYTQVLGGLNGLVFTGGIGENSKEIRDRIRGSLSDVNVRVIKTNEELMIARHTYSLLNNLL